MRFSSTLLFWQKRRAHRQQRIYIVPSRAGYGYALLLLVMLLGAINYDNSLGHLLCFLLASLGQVAMHHTNKNLRQLRLSCSAGEPVFSEQSARFNVTVHNDNNRDCYQLAISQKKANTARWRYFRSFQLIGNVAEIAAGKSQSCSVALATHKRGWLTLDTISLASTYPLGLFFAWSVYKQPVKTLVYPKPAGQRPLPLSINPGQQQHHGEQPGEDDFSGLRNYRTGEPIHRIAWKAVARDNIMRSKQFASPQGQELVLSWFQLSDIADIEARLSQLCRWVLQAQAQGHRYALVLPNATLALNRGAAHQHACLTLLALFDGQ